MSGTTTILAMVWEPVFPPVLILLIGLLLAVIALRNYLGSGSRLSLGRRIFLLVFRLAAILLICLFLFQPMIEKTYPRQNPKRIALVALDSSQSMNERDGNGQATRLDTARQLLAESGLIVSGGEDSEIGVVKLFQFDETATPLAPGMLPGLQAAGETTQFHQSISSSLDSVRAGENCVGLFLFSDGHDFELASVQRTAQLARARQTAIYPVALGKQGTIPDIAVHIASYQPFTFVRQHAQIQAAVRIMGSEPRPLRVELLREGELVRDRKIYVASGSEFPVAFEVSEDEPGQYEYEIRVTPLPGEREINNNRAFTFLNVTDSKIPVMLIEGSPHWDTTFLRRTLLRNSRVELTTVTSLGGRDVQVITSDSRETTVPESEEYFRSFPLVILGRGIDRVLSAEGCENLAGAVEEGGTTLVYARGTPGEHSVFEELAPATWTDSSTGPVRLVKGRGSGQIVPMEILATAPGGSQALPELPLARGIEKPKTLAAVEAMAEDADQQNASPAFVHRRHGRGQVLAVAVGGLWKWSLNSRSEASNNVYDRFWNQLLLNLIARSSVNPSDRSRLTVSSANMALGERVTFALYIAAGQPAPVDPKVTIFLEDEIVSVVTLAESEGGRSWDGILVAEKPGRYRGVIYQSDEPLECRFAVYQEQRETTEVAPDFSYLRKLAEASGGRLLEPVSLKEAIASLGREAVAEAEAPPIVRRQSLWDRPEFFYLLFALLGTEWFFRRRWGLT